MSKATQIARSARAKAALDVVARQQAKLQNEHTAMFLAFHGNSIWAQAKVAAGTVRYTAEGFAFLSHAVKQREADKAFDAELDAKVAEEKADAKA